MSAESTDPTYGEVVGELLYALADCWDYCQLHGDGANLPEMLRDALTRLALIVHPASLSEHRPGSWEAVHIEALDLSALYNDEFDKSAGRYADWSKRYERAWDGLEIPASIP